MGDDNVKVLMINGSPHINGNSSVALNEMKKIFDGENIETEVVHIGNMNIRGCTSCGVCHKTGKCVFDEVNRTWKTGVRFT